MDQVIEWFRDSAVATFVQAVLAIAALIVSIFAIKKSNKTARRL